MMDEIEDRRVAEEDRRSDAYVLNALLVEAKAEVVRVRTELVLARAERDHYRHALEDARDDLDRWTDRHESAAVAGALNRILKALEQGGAA